MLGYIPSLSAAEASSFLQELKPGVWNIHVTSLVNDNGAFKLPQPMATYEGGYQFHFDKKAFNVWPVDDRK